MTPQRIGSHYLLHEQIGQGGMGTVWRAEDDETGQWRAIKVLRPEYARDPAAVARFMRERNALLTLRHSNVVTLHDMIVEGERLALVMDLLTEGDLDKLRRDHGGVLPPWQAAELVAQVCDGLAAAHAAGIVHRDLKPGNVLMDGGRARLTDFGIARIGGEAPVTGAGAVMGTVSYMAPETLRGADPAPACDVYAAGVTLHELLTGRPPFTGQAAMVLHDHLNVTPRRPDGLPEPLWNVIASCLAKDPADRPTAAGLAEALQRPEVFSAVTLPAQPAPQAVATAPNTLPEASARHTVTGIGWLSPAGPAQHQPLPGAVPTLATGTPANSGNARGKLRTWGIAAAALLLVGAAVGAFTAFGGGGAQTPAADIAAASPSVTESASTVALGQSSSPAASPSKTASLPSDNATATAPTASDPAVSASTAAAAPTPTAAAPTVTATVTASAAPAPTVTTTEELCGNYPADNGSIWRCNGTSWIGISCSSAENNADGSSSPFNVLRADNNCGDRVWLHEYMSPTDQKSGWAYCISPRATVSSIPAQYPMALL